MSEPIQGQEEIPPGEEVKLPDDRGEEPWFEKPEGEEAAPETEKDAAAEAKPAEKKAEKPAEPDKKTPPKLTPHDYVQLRRREREASRMKAEAQQLLANAEQRQRADAEDQALKEADPYAWAVKHKIPFRKIVEHVSKEGDEDPRDVKLREMEARYSALEEKLNPLIEEKQRTAADMQAAETMQQELTFVASEITDAADELPYLSAIGADHVAQIARARYYAYDQSGQPKDLAEILGELEGEYQELDEKLARIRKPSGSQSKRLGPPSREEGSVRSVKHEKRGGPALTERAISQRATPDRELSDDETKDALASRITFG